MARPWSARCYGVARQREGSRQNSLGAPACFLSGISGWFSLSLGAWVPKNLARRNMEVWLRRRRRRFGFSDFRFEAAAATLSGTGSASPRPDRNSWLRGRVNPFPHPYARARALMARPWSAGCYGVARQREGSRQNSIGGSGVLSLRHFGLVLFIPWRLGAEESGAANMEVWLRRRRRRFRFSDFRFEAAAATLSGTGSASPRPDRNSWLRGPR